MWQSAQEAPARKWVLWFVQNSYSGCRMKAMRKPVTACVHSWTRGSLRICSMMASIVIAPYLPFCQGK